MYFHQGGHGGAPPMEQMNRWFTRYLYGVQNGVEQDPRARIVREGAPRTEPTPYADYPVPGSANVTLHPGAGGAATGPLSAAQRTAEGRETLVDNVEASGEALARADRSPHRLLYATPTLTEPVHVSGTPSVTIRLASSKPAANLSVWLVALPWEPPAGRGSASPSLITRGWADPQNHRSLTRHGHYDSKLPGEPLIPGQFYTVTFNLQPDDQVIPAGKRIALMILSSDRDFTLWPQPGTELTIDLGATALVLPVVGGGDALARALGERGR
jgi:X-Pro dipeptidyl-peptidase